MSGYSPLKALLHLFREALDEEERVGAGGCLYCVLSGLFFGHIVCESARLVTIYA